MHKPFFNPPNWLFGPVWALLYTLIGISFYLIWITPTITPKRTAYATFYTQLMLNALWSLVFFGLHSLWGGVIIILALLISIVAMIIRFRKIQPVAAYLLVPYLAWVAFATCLNIAVAVMN